ncbi:MAG: phosphatidylglycerol lysyltransferase domain-containing protein, partial [Ruminococcus sp.]
KGGLLRVDGELAAFSIGEPICSNTFGVHIEKADTRFHGAYPAMAQAFAAHFAMDYTYLNREEDLGIPGLRKSKLSYYPELLLEKWTATCDTPEKLL